MEVTIKSNKKVNVHTLKVSAGVRYWEDAEVNGVDDTTGELIPCKNGDRWEPVIDVDSGKILNWRERTTADIHYKVCDDGNYKLFDSEDNLLSELDSYVPKIMYPEDEGYGDYIIMKVDESGVIQKWNPTFDEFPNF